MNIPSSAKAIVLSGPETFKVDSIHLPKLQKGKVLVKMAFAPVNPSDLAFLTGNYGLKKAFPVVPGLEGSGVVVASGGGFLANMILNKRVACSAPPTGNGTWAEYMLTDAKNCIKLDKNVSLEQGAMFFVNPLTALSFSKQAKEANADLVVLTAADSALSQMILYFMKKIGVPVLGITRKTERIAYLENKGFEKAISSSENDYLDQIKNFGKKYKKVMFFDAIGGGTIPYAVLNTLPDKTQMIIYGRLEFTDPQFAPQEILFKENVVKGYWLSKEMARKSILSILSDVRKVQGMLKSGFETQINQTISIDDLQKGLELYTSHMSAGKVLLAF